MTTIYNLIDRDDGFLLSSFISGLTKDKLKKIEKEAAKIYQQDNYQNDKETIFFELIKEQDTHFKKINALEIVI